MKHRGIEVLAVLLAVSLLGCGQPQAAGRVENTNAVNAVIAEQMEEESSTETEAETTQPETTERETAESQKLETETAKAQETGAQEVDYDLTTMSSDMVYATVAQLMQRPDAYLGKTFRMAGLYAPAYYEPTGQYYHYCIIKDAAACCAQGLEFVWDDGSHAYPEEYPKENSVILVTGVFETYEEEESEYLYCHLVDASMEVLGAQGS